MISPMPADTSHVNSPALICCAAAGSANARANTTDPAAMTYRAIHFSLCSILESYAKKIAMSRCRVSKAEH
jgi:hypothetical protein